MQNKNTYSFYANCGGRCERCRLLRVIEFVVVVVTFSMSNFFFPFLILFQSS